MSKPPGGPVVIGLTTAVCVVVLWVHASSTSHPQAAIIAPNRNSATPKPTGKSRTVRRKTAVRTAPKSGSHHKRHGGIPRKLKKQVRTFIEDAYLVKPDDTPTERRERLSPYLGPILSLNALNEIEKEIRSSRSFVKRFDAQQLTIEGTPSLAKATMLPDAKDKSALVIRAPVIVVTTDPTGTVLNRHVSNSVSKWQRVGSDWFVIDFNL
jgi:hypothetical protein